ncbi:MAG: hypothetical protein ACYCQI_05350 [Gammaproteobacteria bacterium]
MESGRKGDSSPSEFPEKKLNPATSILPPPIRPSANKLFHNLPSMAKKESLPDETFHEIDKVTEVNPTEIRTYFLKKKRTKSETPNLEPTVYELEAVCAAFYKLLAPHHTPATYAVYDEKAQEYSGVASEEIPGFRSTAMDPLKEEDLNIDFLTKTNLSISEIDEKDEALQKLEEQMESFERRRKKLELADAFDASSLKELTDTLKREEAEVKKQMIDFFVDAEIKNSLTKKNLEAYRIIKGLAITLTTSYIFWEDDLHQNNLSKYGKRIDFDMSLWPITYLFKTIMPYQFMEPLFKFRKLNIDKFIVTEYDIRHFPNIKDSQPFYWPTKYLGTSSHSIPTMVKSAFGKTTNPYPYQINLLFQKLENNPIFIYHQFRILAKFILSDAHMYKQIALQHLRKECLFNSKLLIDIITKELEDRIAIFENTLLSIPEFANYLKQHGEKIIDELCDSASEQSVDFDKKQIKRTYADFVAIILLKIQRKEFEKTSTSKLGSEIKEINSYKNISEELKKSMNTYKNPGATAAWGLFRSKDNYFTATELTKFAEKHTPKNPTENFAAIRALKEKITVVRGNLKVGGEMYRQLTDLLTMINKSLPDAKSNPSPSGSPKKSYVAQ